MVVGYSAAQHTLHTTMYIPNSHGRIDQTRR